MKNVPNNTHMPYYYTTITTTTYYTMRQGRGIWIENISSCLHRDGAWAPPEREAFSSAKSGIKKCAWKEEDTSSFCSML
jgi:hypothetical protein